MEPSGSPTLFSSEGSGQVHRSALKRRPSLFTAGLFSYFLSCAVVIAQTPTLKDPLFGLSLPMSSALERANRALMTECAIGASGSEQQSWIFAAVHLPEGEYLILGGFARTRHDGVAGPWVSDWKGELVRVNEDHCEVIDPPREALLYPASASIPIRDVVVNDLLADAVTRFSRVFGSRKEFIRALRQQGVYPEGPRLEVLRIAIEASTLP